AKIKNRTARFVEPEPGATRVAKVQSLTGDFTDLWRTTLIGTRSEFGDSVFLRGIAVRTGKSASDAVGELLKPDADFVLYAECASGVAIAMHAGLRATLGKDSYD